MIRELTAKAIILIAALASAVQAAPPNNNKNEATDPPKQLQNTTAISTAKFDTQIIGIQKQIIELSKSLSITGNLATKIKIKSTYPADTPLTFKMLDDAMNELEYKGAIDDSARFISSSIFRYMSVEKVKQEGILSDPTNSLLHIVSSCYLNPKKLLQELVCDRSSYLGFPDDGVLGEVHFIEQIPQMEGYLIEMRGKGVSKIQFFTDLSTKSKGNFYLNSEVLLNNSNFMSDKAIQTAVSGLGVFEYSSIGYITCSNTMKRCLTYTMQPRRSQVNFVKLSFEQQRAINMTQYMKDGQQVVRVMVGNSLLGTHAFVVLRTPSTKLSSLLAVSVSGKLPDTLMPPPFGDNGEVEHDYCYGTRLVAFTSNSRDEAKILVLRQLSFKTATNRTSSGLQDVNVTKWMDLNIKKFGIVGIESVKCENKFLMIIGFEEPHINTTTRKRKLVVLELNTASNMIDVDTENMLRYQIDDEFGVENDGFYYENTFIRSDPDFGSKNSMYQSLLSVKRELTSNHVTNLRVGHLFNTAYLVFEGVGFGLNSSRIIAENVQVTLDVNDLQASPTFNLNFTHLNEQNGTMKLKNGKKKTELKESTFKLDDFVTYSGAVASLQMRFIGYQPYYEQRDEGFPNLNNGISLLDDKDASIGRVEHRGVVVDQAYSSIKIENNTYQRTRNFSIYYQQFNETLAVIENNVSMYHRAKKQGSSKRSSSPQKLRCKVYGMGVFLDDERGEIVVAVLKNQSIVKPIGPSPIPTPSPSPNPAPSPTGSPSASPTPSPTPTPTPSPTSSKTPTPAPSPTGSDKKTNGTAGLTLTRLHQIKQRKNKIIKVSNTTQQNNTMPRTITIPRYELTMYRLSAKTGKVIDKQPPQRVETLFQQSPKLLPYRFKGDTTNTYLIKNWKTLTFIYKGDKNFQNLKLALKVDWKTQVYQMLRLEDKLVMVWALNGTSQLYQSTFNAITDKFEKIQLNLGFKRPINALSCSEQTYQKSSEDPHSKCFVYSGNGNNFLVSLFNSPDKLTKQMIYIENDDIEEGPASFKFTDELLIRHFHQRNEIFGIGYRVFTTQFGIKVWDLKDTSNPFYLMKEFLMAFTANHNPYTFIKDQKTGKSVLWMRQNNIVPYSSVYAIESPKLSNLEFNIINVDHLATRLQKTVINFRNRAGDISRIKLSDIFEYDDTGAQIYWLVVLTLMACLFTFICLYCLRRQREIIRGKPEAGKAGSVGVEGEDMKGDEYEKMAYGFENPDEEEKGSDDDSEDSAGAGSEVGEKQASGKKPQIMFKVEQEE